MKSTYRRSGMTPQRPSGLSFKVTADALLLLHRKQPAHGYVERKLETALTVRPCQCGEGVDLRGLVRRWSSTYGADAVSRIGYWEFMRNGVDKGNAGDTLSPDGKAYVTSDASGDGGSDAVPCPTKSFQTLSRGASDSKSPAARRAGSSPALGTTLTFKAFRIFRFVC